MKHEKAVHVDGEHCCDCCSKTFKRLTHLKRHMRVCERCAARRQRLEEVPDRSGEQPEQSAEQPAPSTVPTSLPDEDSSESEDVSFFYMFTIYCICLADIAFVSNGIFRLQ
ncbi:hypothetical protein HOLleu_03937 [Holothuria leucospilota]|uniref:C2H2-type domain-containing protein n=1 Tax=Holothuria leucospilota TaxID=206669 RepID=A0A9Q1CSM9_HOLLE|nr:hypothetical protein HOLleu_03937 [Holothuria leucospilota]